MPASRSFRQTASVLGAYLPFSIAGNFSWNLWLASRYKSSFTGPNC
jgi:hypothetical protein